MAVLTFDDSVTLADFNMVNTKGNEIAMLGAISSATQKIPGQKGLYDFGSEVGTMTNKYPVTILVQDPVERSYQLRAFKNFLTDAYGYPRYIKFHSSDEPDVYFWAKIANAPVPKNYSGSADFILQVTNFEGIKYSIVEADEILWGSEEIHFQANYELGHTGSGANQTQISENTLLYPTVSGLAVHPYFIMQGSGSNVTIECNEKIITVGSFDGTVEINTADFISYVNGKEKGMRMDKFYLVKDKPVSIKGIEMDFILTIQYRDEL